MQEETREPGSDELLGGEAVGSESERVEREQEVARREDELADAAKQAGDEPGEDHPDRSEEADDGEGE